MASNNLTPTQDIITREFYEVVALADNVLATSPAHKRQLKAILLEMLNYIQLPSGAFVQADTKLTIPFGSNDYSKYKDEWTIDAAKAMSGILEDEKETQDEADNDTDTVNASTSSEAEDTEVRQAVLPEEV